MNRSTYLLILNKRAIKIDKNKIDLYSARNRTMKGTELNSVLNPLTSSDSPSEKSNGLRLDSAKEVTTRRNILTKVNEPSERSFGVRIL